MKQVNIKYLYPFVKENILVEVSDDIYHVLKQLERDEKNRTERIRKNKSYFSLDRDDGIEYDAIDSVKTPEEITFQKILHELVMKEIAKLPSKQFRRLYAYFYMDISIGKLAKIEGVSRSAIIHSITRGIKNLEKNSFFSL